MVETKSDTKTAKKGVSKESLDFLDVENDKEIQSQYVSRK